MRIVRAFFSVYLFDVFTASGLRFAQGRTRKKTTFCFKLMNPMKRQRSRRERRKKTEKKKKKKTCLIIKSDFSLILSLSLTLACSVDGSIDYIKTFIFSAIDVSKTKKKKKKVSLISQYHRWWMKRNLKRFHVYFIGYDLSEKMKNDEIDWWICLWDNQQSFDLMKEKRKKWTRISSDWIFVLLIKFFRSKLWLAEENISWTISFVINDIFRFLSLSRWTSSSSSFCHEIQLT